MAKFEIPSLEKFFPRKGGDIVPPKKGPDIPLPRKTGGGFGELRPQRRPDGAPDPRRGKTKDLRKKKKEKEQRPRRRTRRLGADDGVIKLEEALDTIEEWYWGDPQGFEDSILSKEGFRKGLKNLKGSAMAVANFLEAFEVEFFEAIVEQMRALKLAQRKTGKRGRWVQVPRGRPKKGQPVQGKVVWHRDQIGKTSTLRKMAGGAKGGPMKRGYQPRAK